MNKKKIIKVIGGAAVAGVAGIAGAKVIKRKKAERLESMKKDLDSFICNAHSMLSDVTDPSIIKKTVIDLRDYLDTYFLDYMLEYVSYDVDNESIDFRLFSYDVNDMTVDENGNKVDKKRVIRVCYQGRCIPVTVVSGDPIPEYQFDDDEFYE